MVKMPVSYADSAWLVPSKLTKCLLSHSRDHQSMAHLPQLSSAGDHAESCRAHEKRYSFCAGCSVAIKELARSHSTDTEVIDRAGRLPFSSKVQQASAKPCVQGRLPLGWLLRFAPSPIPWRDFSWGRLHSAMTTHSLQEQH